MTAVARPVGVLGLENPLYGFSQAFGQRNSYVSLRICWRRNRLSLSWPEGLAEVPTRAPVKDRGSVQRLSFSLAVCYSQSLPIVPGSPRGQGKASLWRASQRVLYLQKEAGAAIQAWPPSFFKEHTH